MNFKQKKKDQDNYRAFLELVLIFLEGTPSRGVKLLKSGLIHHAR